MDDHARRTLEFVSSQLVFISALLHLGIGLFEWYRYARFGFLVPPDGRWPLFVLSGLVILAGLFVAYRAEDRRPYYALGIFVMLGYVVVFYAWHYLGHRAWILFGPGPGSEPLSLQTVIDHALAGPEEVVALTAELLAVVLLAILYLRSDGTTLWRWLADRRPRVS